MLIEEHFHKVVHHAFIVYIRSKNHLESIPVTISMKDKANKILDEIFGIIALSRYPQARASKKKCGDCTYRNLCVV